MRKGETKNCQEFYNAVGRSVLHVRLAVPVCYKKFSIVRLREARLRILFCLNSKLAHLLLVGASVHS